MNPVLKVAKSLAALTLEDRKLAISFGRELGGEKRKTRKRKLATKGIIVVKVRKPRKGKLEPEQAAS